MTVFLAAVIMFAKPFAASTFDFVQTYRHTEPVIIQNMRIIGHFTQFVLFQIPHLLLYPFIHPFNLHLVDDELDKVIKVIQVFLVRLQLVCVLS